MEGIARALSISLHNKENQANRDPMDDFYRLLRVAILALKEAIDWLNRLPPLRQAALLGPDSFRSSLDSVDARDGLYADLSGYLMANSRLKSRDIDPSTALRQS